MAILIVVNQAKDWPFEDPAIEVVEARSYLTRPEYGGRRGLKLFNLCRSYRYQSIGYYVTLLASARGHRPLPSITTIQDMKSRTMINFVSEDLDELIQKSLAKLQSSEFTLSIYFGCNLAKRYGRLAKELFNLFEAPLLRAHFSRDEEGAWLLRRIHPIPVGEIPSNHRSFLLRVANEYFAARRRSVPKRSTKYDLAILVNPAEKTPPSDEKAIRLFTRAAESIGFSTEIIDREDFSRIAEFDALFLRETTGVNHHTYRFARRAAREGLVVMDDPESIVRCTNKVFLAELMNRHRVPIPRTCIVHRENIAEVITCLGFPCILKEPDSSFSQGVIKVRSEKEMREALGRIFDKSDFVIAQEFVPTEFDWRIGVLDQKPLFACKYFMVKKHWQIYRNDRHGRQTSGGFETLPLGKVPPPVLEIALAAANLIGDGLYGVDVKEVDGKPVVIEVNDNPSVDSGVEDLVLRDGLYRTVMQSFLRRIDQAKRGSDPA